mmetsp:Transcript_14797/g.19403  ORF Transcript_14797/g.19403 Transcript_14797/m.19403 type:complete len:269 (-) Transcript_14797:183-989(-)
MTKILNYCNSWLFCMVIFCGKVNCFHHPIPHAPIHRANPQILCAQSSELNPGEVNVRFVNTKSGMDIVQKAIQGDNLLQIADRAGVHIPRSCRADTCGTCTVDMKDPNAAIYTDAKGMTNRPGHQTIRACVAKVVVPDGMDEMVIDVFRSKLVSQETKVNPMSRFSVDWESKYQGLQTAEADKAMVEQTALMRADDMHQRSLAHARKFSSAHRQKKDQGLNIDLSTPSRRSSQSSSERRELSLTDNPFVSEQQARSPKKRFSRADWNN